VSGELAFRNLAEGWQLQQIIFWDLLNRLSGFAPSRESSGDDKGAKALFSQKPRHTGAGGFARSSTVKINVLVVREVVQFFSQLIRLDANGARNPLSAGIVISMAAHVSENDLFVPL
jgi:hypothetical protein